MKPFLISACLCLMPLGVLADTDYYAAHYYAALEMRAKDVDPSILIDAIKSDKTTKGYRSDAICAVVKAYEGSALEPEYFTDLQLGRCRSYKKLGNKPEAKWVPSTPIIH